LQKTYYAIINVTGGYAAKVAVPPEYQIVDFIGAYTVYPNNFGRIIQDIHRAYPESVHLGWVDFESKATDCQYRYIKLLQWKGEKMKGIIKSIEGSFIDWCRAVVASEEQYVILDTETTGLYGEIIDLAIIDTKGHQLYNALLKPLCAIEKKAQETHHITAEMLESCPTIGEEWSKICDIVQGRTVITYNAKFDSERIAYSLARHGLNTCEMCQWEYECALVNYADFYGEPNRKGYNNTQWQSLSAACYQQGIMVPSGLHRAMPDTQMTLALLCKVAATGENSPRYED
jgi:DNA polymerase-3 subunit epsilon